MVIKGIDFNVNLADLTPESFATYYTDCKWEKKLGVTAEAAQKSLKAEKVRIDKAELAKLKK